jgi:branched-chain amino acid transport system substrate-binding protein
MYGAPYFQPGPLAVVFKLREGMMKITKIGNALVLCLLVVSVIAFNLMVQSNATAQSPREIKVGVIEDFTGPASRECGPIGEAIIDYFKWLNQEKGGIDGIPVTVMWADGKYDVPTGLAAYNRMIDQKIVALISTWAALHLAVHGRVAMTDHIPLLHCRGLPPRLLETPGWHFVLNPQDADAMGRWVTWFLKERWKENRPWRVALLYNDTPMGRSAFSGPGIKWLKANPMVDIVDDVPIQVAAADLTPQLAKLKTEKLDAILQGGSLTPNIRVINEAMVRLEFKVLTFCVSMWQPHMVIEAGIPIPGDWMGIDNSAYRWQKDVKGIRLSNEIYKKLHNTTEDRMDFTYSNGFAGALTLHQALRIALKNVGYENLDGTAVRDAFEQITDFDPWGLTAPISFTPTCHTTKLSYMVEIPPGTLETKVITNPRPAMNIAKVCN